MPLFSLLYLYKSSWIRHKNGLICNFFPKFTFLNIFSVFYHRAVYAAWKQDVFLSIQVLFQELFCKRVNSFFELALVLKRNATLPKAVPVHTSQLQRLLQRNNLWVVHKYNGKSASSACSIISRILIACHMEIRSVFALVYILLFNSRFHKITFFWK